MEDTSVNNLPIHIKSIFREYKVNFDINHTRLINKFNGNKYFVIIDNKVRSLHKERLKWIDDAECVIGIDATEDNKDINTVQSVAEKSLKNNINKNDIIIVIGGGIVQDLAAFTANIIKRGVSWFFFPTTLLAMCDSCIGSKVGINMSGYKNQLGIFWPPTEIFVDVNFLSTLDKTEILSGIGEIIKVHLISSEEDFKNLENSYDAIVDDYDELKKFIYRSLEIKKEIVEKDEFDVGYRHILNYGHTFGHAIEAYTNNVIPHGIGVSIGMNIANYISLRKGYIKEEEYSRMNNTINKNIIYENLDYSDLNKMKNYLRADKKFDGKELKVILSKGVGKIFIDKVCVDDSLANLINEYAISYKLCSSD